MKKNIVKVDYSEAFNKQFKKAPLPIKKAFRDRLTLFQSEQFHPFLHNHQLVGKYVGFRSINVTGDWRAIYKEIILDAKRIIVLFHLFGTHSQLYK